MGQAGSFGGPKTGNPRDMCFCAFSFREGTAYMEARLGLGHHGRQAPVVSNKLCWRPEAEQTALHVRKLHRTWAGTEWVSNSYADGGPSIALLTGAWVAKADRYRMAAYGARVCATLSRCVSRDLPASQLTLGCVKPETGRSSAVLQKAHMVKSIVQYRDPPLLARCQLIIGCMEASPKLIDSWAKQYAVSVSAHSGM